MNGARLVVVGQGQTAGIGVALTAGQRPRDPGLDVLGRHRRAGARHNDFGQAAGIDLEELVRQQRVEDAIDRDAAGFAETGRAEDRNMRSGAGIFHQVADAHDLAGDCGGGLDGQAGRSLRPRRIRRKALGE